MLRRIGEHRKAISDEALLEYVKAHPKHGRPRIYKELRDAGYGVTKQRVENASRSAMPVGGSKAGPRAGARFWSSLPGFELARASRACFPSGLAG